MRGTKFPLFVGMVCALAVPVLADWDPDQEAKWVQFPDLGPTGIDVNATSPYILGDDFQCKVTGPITDIHIWGSWYQDILPDGDPHNVQFILSIHADIPDPDPGNPDTWSMPGDVLWWRTFQPGEFTARIYAEGLQEGWMDPPDWYEPFADTVCWQYNFFIDEAEDITAAQINSVMKRRDFGPMFCLLSMVFSTVDAGAEHLRQSGAAPATLYGIVAYGVPSRYTPSPSMPTYNTVPSSESATTLAER